MLENIHETLRSTVTNALNDEELSDCYLIDLVLNNTKLEVYIDTDAGVSFKQCQRLSRLVEAELDESGILGEKYILEVSSPGISRPLKFLRQYPRNIGREIEVKTKDGNTMKGILKSVEGETLVLESKGKNKKETINSEIIFDAVDSSRILISFGKKKIKK